MKIIKNTYPKTPNIPHAEVGDEVQWTMGRGQFNLIRISDNKTVFGTSPVDSDGKLRSNGQRPIMVGLIASVKSKGWYLEVAP